MRKEYVARLGLWWSSTKTSGLILAAGALLLFAGVRFVSARSLGPQKDVPPLTDEAGYASFASENDSSANHLIHESSPYLLLHAHNPVDWYPWGQQAFEKARREQKPIFLSIGYYTCHWCHVMERESYSNPEIAAVLNKYFIAIKLDREERPDVDRLYVNYVEATTGSAGYPLNVFLTPDLKPFFGGIYFPPDRLNDLLLKTADAWSKNREHIAEKASRAAQELAQTQKQALSSTTSLQLPVLDKALRQIASTYDRANGGFGEAPKFPRPTTLEFLLRAYARTADPSVLDVPLATLRAMARGGIHDQLGGGYHRYSTDAKWRVPHFEKMISDQAQLTVTYSEAYQITHDPFFASIARDIADFSLRELQLSSGGFGSALDADSGLLAGRPETGEGAFYVWTAEEIAGVLGQQEAAIFNYAYGVESGGNIPPRQDTRRELAHKNVLYQRQTEEEVARHFGVSKSEASEQLASARKTLFQARSRRPRPPLDDKVVTAWNGMMISALAHVSQALDEPAYLAVAESTARFLEAHLYDAKSKRLWRSYREGSATVDGCLDDYSQLINGLVDLYQAGFDVHWLEWAVALQEKQDELFWDRQQGGYFDASGSDSALLMRTREAYDRAEPSPNSTAAINLLRLAQVTDRADWHDKAQKTLSAFGARLESHPEAMPAFASALDFHLAHTRQILIAGDPSAGDTRELLRVVNERFLPNAILLLADGGSRQEQLAGWLPLVVGAHRVKGQATAYICENHICRLPATDPIVVQRLLDERP